MKTKIQFLILISIIGLSCQNQKTNSPNKIEITKVFEDNVIKAELKEIEIEGNILKANLELKNKTANTTSFQFKDFVFVCGDNYGIIPAKETSIKRENGEIPNYKNLSEEEKKIAREERRQRILKQKIQFFQFWNSEAFLKSNERISKKIELEFKDNIKVEELEFYFDGQYKRLLSNL